jgi:hypothetical protein
VLSILCYQTATSLRLIMPDRVPPDGQSTPRSGRRARAATFALLSVVTIVIASGGVMVVAQLNSLKTELASTRREIAVAKDKIDRLERRIDETAAAAARPQTRPERAATAGGGTRALELTREEIQLVRDYIKVPPAPAGVMATIAVGTPVPAGVLSPLPSQITEKMPKLIGASFMTDRNGAIVIVRRGSTEADLVINPN